MNKNINESVKKIIGLEKAIELEKNTPPSFMFDFNSTPQENNHLKEAKENIDVMLKWNIQPKLPTIKAVYKNEDKRTVVIKWADDSVTKATCSKEDYFDLTVGFAIAYVKKVFGGKKKLLKTIKKLNKGERK